MLKLKSQESALSSEREIIMSQLKSAKRLIELEQYNAAFMLFEEAHNKRKILDKEDWKNFLIDYAFALANKEMTYRALSLLNDGQKELDNDEEIIEAKIIILLRNCSLHKTHDFDKNTEYKLRQKSIESRFKSGFWNDFLFYSKVIVSKENYDEQIILRKTTKLLMNAVKRDFPKKIDFLYYLGITLYLQHMVHEALECFDTVLAIDRKYRNSYVISQFFDNVKSRKPTKKEVIFYPEDLKYKTTRGIFVRSKIEALIDNVYSASGIAAEYEPELNLEGEKVHPDWKLETNDGYILHEHIGSKESRKRMNYKKQVYESHGIKYFCTYEKDEKDIESAIMNRLNEMGVFVKNGT